VTNFYTKTSNIFVGKTDEKMLGNSLMLGKPPLLTLIHVTSLEEIFQYCSQLIVIL